MSKTIPIPIGPGSDPARSKYAGSGLIINAFAEASQAGKAAFALYSDPGLVEFATFANEGSIRGILRFGSIAYVVSGETLYKVTSEGATTEIGDIIGERSVIFALNAQSPYPQIVIVSDTVVYLLRNDVLEVFPDADLPTTTTVVSATFIDQYIVFLFADGRFFWSEVNDADDIDPLNFKTAEGRPDGGVVNVTIGREMWVLGDETVEVYVTSSDDDDPFPRLPGGFISRGCKAKHSAKPFDNSLIWVDDLARVVKPESGFTPKRVSNHAVESDIQASIDAQTAADIEGFVWNEGGHEFYQLSGSNWTWVLDAATGYWHKKESLGEARSKIRHYARAFDTHLVGDFESATLYRMSMTAYDEDGDELVVTVRTPIIDEQGYYITWDSLLLDMELGVGSGADTAAAEYNPTVMLNWSDDGGNTYCSERERPLGRASNWKGRVMFNQLGTSKEHGRIFQIRISAAVNKTIIQASARIRLMPAQAGA